MRASRFLDAKHLLIVGDHALHIYPISYELSAEVAKDAILGLVDHGLKRVDTLLQAVMRGLCLRAP